MNNNRQRIKRVDREIRPIIEKVLQSTDWTLQNGKKHMRLVHLPTKLWMPLASSSGDRLAVLNCIKSIHKIQRLAGIALTNFSEK